MANSLAKNLMIGALIAAIATGSYFTVGDEPVEEEVQKNNESIVALDVSKPKVLNPEDIENYIYRGNHPLRL